MAGLAVASLGDKSLYITSPWMDSKTFHVFVVCATGFHAFILVTDPFTAF